MTSLEDLLKKSIPELSDLFVRRERRVPKGLLEALEVDRRQGAHQLAKRIRERYRENLRKGSGRTSCCASRLNSGRKVMDWSRGATKQVWRHSPDPLSQAQ